MNRKIDFILHTSAPDWWDKEVEDNGGVYSSTSKWARAYQNLNIGNGLYLEVIIDEKRSILVLMYEVVIGGILLLSLPNFILSVLQKVPFLKSINMHHQPVIIDKALLDDEDQLADITEVILKHIISISETRNVNIKPADYVCFHTLDAAKKVKKSISNLSLTGTVRIPLNVNVDDKYKSLPKNLHGSLKKASTLSVVTKEVDVNAFYEELYKSWKSYGLAVNPSSYYKELANTSEGQIKFYLSYHDDNPLAGSAIMLYGKTISEFSMFATSYSRESKIPGGDMLKWDLIKMGIEKGYDFIDLNMIDVKDEISEKSNNINYFKLKWDGYILYGVTIEKLNFLTSFIRKIKLQLLGK